MLMSLCDVGMVVVGGANVDLKCQTHFATQLFGASNPGRIIWKPGGVARNIAHNLALLGVRTILISAVGADHLADYILTVTAQAGVDISHVCSTDLPTGQYIAIMKTSGELFLGISAMECIEKITPEYLLDHQDTVAAAKFVVADCNLNSSSLLWLAKMSNRHGVRFAVECVSVEKCKKIRQLFSENIPLSLLFGNHDEVKALTGISTARDDADSYEASARFLHTRGVRNVIISAGDCGCFVSNGEQSRIVAPFRTIVRDVTGAGDTALAGTLWALSAGCDLFQAASIGQQAAAFTIADDDNTLPISRIPLLRAALTRIQETI